MIYSGADLIRNAGQQRAQAERLANSSDAIRGVNSATAGLDQETQSALQRFARFIHKEKTDKSDDGKKKKSKPSSGLQVLKAAPAQNPYVSNQRKRLEADEKGQMLDIFA